MKKSLLIVTEAFEFGGVESYIRCEVAELKRLGWEVHLACGNRFSNAMLPDGLASLTAGLALGPEADIAGFLGAVDSLVGVARREGVTAIHAHPFTALLPAVACAISLGLPCAITLHGPASISGSYGEAYDFMLASLTLPFVSHVVAVSDEVAELASPYIDPRRMSVLPNAIEPVAAAASAANGRWLTVGRLDNAKVKGIETFARAGIEIGLGGVDICGDGPARPWLEESLAAMIADGQVRMLGERPDANALMSNYDGVAGMGRVALEGLAVGVPVVLVGYEGVKGLLDEALYAKASHSNLSGRGLPDITASTLAGQLQDHGPEVIADVSARAGTEREAGTLWRRFVKIIDDAAPVKSAILEGYLRSLRTLDDRSGASAYWSREVMDVLSRLVASPSAQGTPLAQAFAIHSEAFTRTVVEQQMREAIENAKTLPQAVADATAERFGWADSRGGLERVGTLLDRLVADAAAEQSHWKDSREVLDQIARLVSRVVADVNAGHSDRVDSHKRLDRIARLLESLGEDVSSSKEIVRHELQGQAQDVLEALKVIEVLQPNVAEMREEVRQHKWSLDRLQRNQQDALAQIHDAITWETNASRGAEHAIADLVASIESSMLVKLSDIEHSIDAHAEANREGEALRVRLAVIEQELQSVYRSTSWALTRPMRAVKRLMVDPRETSRHLKRMMSTGEAGVDESGSIGWPLRSHLRQAWNFLRRTARTGRLDPSDKAKLRRMFRSSRVILSESAGLGVGHTVPDGSGMEDVFVWAVIDWHFRFQRPQHLAAAMAGKGHRVFYISNNFVDSVKPGFSVEPLDKTERLFQINLNVLGAPPIYFDVASAQQVNAIGASLASLLEWTGTTRSISLVQHPFWLEPAQSLPNMRLVYDCMDHHGGFKDNAANVLAGERTLVGSADLLIVTSQWLYDEMENESANIAMIRNATEYEHFCARPSEVFVDRARRRIIGYYGAIAEWFDVDLIRRVAVDHPRDLVLLVGRDTTGAAERLHDLRNVRFIGEVSYKELPYWLHAFDVCLLPFRVIPLTLATNPVKVYEYLSAGKPTVSVDLPEMSQFAGLVRVADDAADFSRQVSTALEPADSDAAVVEARQAFARQQTWAHRAAELDDALARIVEPKVSIIVLCYNNLQFTQACLESVERYSDYPNLEIIAVDNASSDGTQAYLTHWALGGTHRVFIANDANVGFSAGNNVGLRAATGDYLVILNNDTYVTPGWVRGLMRHLRRNPGAGLVGPVTNNIGNEARIEIHYATMEEMIERAGEYTRRNPGTSFEIATAAFFCVMIPRRVYDAVGPMDEDFGVGFFEDDDYCRRLALNGFKVLCADDVFVHHHLSASFNKLKAGAKQALFDTNKAIYEAKWGPWAPHTYRERHPPV
ncbi:glycosyltransferase [Lysobacter ciconiae]|uniref:Glycosyltransferase n=1 Tax=Novilysobacter ciconiae TaxID=2781022 RepID=A0A7S6UF75_9GAMM|nr:glycosyltransferase [Lysobacter ciconiae]QOW19177.1 glycosyltransferase [Lysobacter ciconiae]